MGRYFFRRYLQIATNLLDQVPTIVVYQNDEGWQKRIFCGEIYPKREIRIVRWKNGTLDVPTYRYYSTDLQWWVYSIRIPFPEGTTAEIVHREIQSIAPNDHFSHIRNSTVFLTRSSRRP